jgi:hypothetical protein
MANTRPGDLFRPNIAKTLGEPPVEPAKLLGRLAFF